eukprot:Opistho-2@24605
MRSLASITPEESEKERDKMRRILGPFRRNSTPTTDAEKRAVPADSDSDDGAAGGSSIAISHKRMEDVDRAVAEAIERASAILERTAEERKRAPPSPPSVVSQWVESVVTFSSQYNGTTWAANMIVGQPRVYPNYGDLHGAWAPGSTSGHEFIHIRYAQPVIFHELDIYETNVPGAIVLITALHITAEALQQGRLDEGEWVAVWAGPAELRQLTPQARIFRPTITRRDIVTRNIRIEMDCRGAPSWCELDAVAMKGDASCSVRREISETTPFQRQLKSMCASSAYSDIAFDVRGVVIPAHRVILAARCEVFRAMLSANMKESETHRIVVPDIDPRAFRLLLEYIYTDAVEIPPAMALWIYFAAEKYSLDALRIMALGAIESCLDVAGVVAVYKYVSELFPELKEACTKFMVSHASVVAHTPDFATLPFKMLLEVTQAFAADIPLRSNASPVGQAASTTRPLATGTIANRLSIPAFVEETDETSESNNAAASAGNPQNLWTVPNALQAGPGVSLLAAMSALVQPGSAPAPTSADAPPDNDGGDDDSDEYETDEDEV